MLLYFLCFRKCFAVCVNTSCNNILQCLLETTPKIERNSTASLQRLQSVLNLGGGLFQLRDLVFSIFAGVAAHLRGMRPTPSTKKDTLMLREKLKL